MIASDNEHHKLIKNFFSAFENKIHFHRSSSSDKKRKSPTSERRPHSSYHRKQSAAVMAVNSGSDLNKTTPSNRGQPCRLTVSHSQTYLLGDGIEEQTPQPFFECTPPSTSEKNTPIKKQRSRWQTRASAVDAAPDFYPRLESSSSSSEAIHDMGRGLSNEGPLTPPPLTPSDLNEEINTMTAEERCRSGRRTWSPIQQPVCDKDKCIWSMEDLKKWKEEIAELRSRLHVVIERSEPYFPHSRISSNSRIYFWKYLPHKEIDLSLDMEPFPGYHQWKQEMEELKERLNDVLKRDSPWQNSSLLDLSSTTQEIERKSYDIPGITSKESLKSKEPLENFAGASEDLFSINDLELEQELNEMGLISDEIPDDLLLSEGSSLNSSSSSSSINAYWMNLDEDQKIWKSETNLPEMTLPSFSDISFDVSDDSFEDLAFDNEDASFTSNGT